MVECKACGKEIAKGVKKCPNCGKDQRNFFMRHKIITGILVVVVLGIIGSAMGGGGDDKPTSGGKTDSSVVVDSEKDDKESEEEVKTEFSVDEIISYKDFDLVFKNQREISGITGDSYLVLDATITSKKDNFSFFGDIQGVTADNEVVDSTIAFVKDDLGDTLLTAWTKKLNKDQKASGYVAFDKEIVKMEIRSSMFSNDLITVIID